ncbi:MAG: PilW family protein [Magnetococcales bacterium]|nr:PilW family protein [Magnetococcales bacterium]
MSHRSSQTTSPSRFPVPGFSLVELMVALTVGLILLTGLVKIFSSTRQTYQLNSNLARLQENARFAVELMSREIAMAGYWGCISDVSPINVLNTPNNYSWAFNDRVRGYDNSSPSSFPSAFQSDVLTGTDAIVLSGIDPDPFTIESHNACSAQFKLAQSHDLLDDEIVFVTDCMQGAIFQITNANQANQTIVHNTGTGTIGNYTKCLGGNCGGACATTWYEYGPDAMLARFRAVAFYIGTGASGEPALFWEVLNRGGTTSAGELVDGVENLQILYGRDTDADGVANQYVTSVVIDAADDWSDVVSVRFGLLLRTTDNVRSGLDSTTYTIAGTDIGVSGTTVTHASDLRVRKVAGTTIQLRN